VRTVRISEQVYDAIATRGKFGDSVDDVLRREFGIKANGAIGTGSLQGRSEGMRRRKFATQRMSPRLENGSLVVEFENGVSQTWGLPDKEDKRGIRLLRQQATEFAKSQNASLGQVNHILKVLTEAGYYLIK
jgi:negative regulator of replication initiation